MYAVCGSASACHPAVNRFDRSLPATIRFSRNIIKPSGFQVDTNRRNKNLQMLRYIPRSRWVAPYARLRHVRFIDGFQIVLSQACISSFPSLQFSYTDMPSAAQEEFSTGLSLSAFA